VFYKYPFLFTGFRNIRIFLEDMGSRAAIQRNLGSGLFFGGRGLITRNICNGKEGFIMSHFTFLTNHANVLNILACHSLITAREVSLKVGITERAVTKIITDLETEGYLVKQKSGRRVRYKINYRMPLRHKTNVIRP